MGRVFALASAGWAALLGRAVPYRGRFCALCKRFSWNRHVQGRPGADPGLWRRRRCPKWLHETW